MRGDSRRTTALLRQWRITFIGALFVTLGALLSSADAILRVKIWAAGWLPWARQIDEADMAQHADKWIHFSLFTMLGWLGLRAWHQGQQRVPLLVALVLLAPATEWLQQYIPGRSASVGDMVADLAGLAIGALLSARHMPAAHSNLD